MMTQITKTFVVMWILKGKVLAREMLLSTYMVSCVLVTSKENPYSMLTFACSSNGAATGRKGEGLEPLLCGKCDVICIYIYTNILKLVLHYFILFSRLDCFSNAFN